MQEDPYKAPTATLREVTSRWPGLNESRSDIVYFCVLIAGLVFWLFPALVFFPASWMWQVATGKMDLFEIRAITTWVGALLVPALVSTGRSLYLFRKEPRFTKYNSAFYLLTLFLVSATVYAFWRPLAAIQFFPW